MIKAMEREFFFNSGIIHYPLQVLKQSLRTGQSVQVIYLSYQTKVARFKVLQATDLAGGTK